ncbi:MAG: response regulator [Anaerolineae bacterium]|jgi:DNA-binding NtrC family response regulator
MAKILVIDPNEAFAAMLQEMLEMDGGYDVAVTHRGSDALRLLQGDSFDLTIVDMDLDPADMGYRDLILNVRRAQPSMRLVLIPLMGEELPPEAHRLDIQGALSKPFFVDDLLPGIQAALSKEVRIGPAPRQAEPAQPAAAGRGGSDQAGQIQQVLGDLIHETQADAVWLLSSRRGGEGVVAHVSTLSEDKARTLAELSVAAVQAAQAVAHFLGQPDEAFEHNMFENDRSRLYIMTLPGDLALVLVTPINTPLGTIRHNLRRTSRHLARLG